MDVNDIEPKDNNVDFIGTTSDMTVYDIGKNINTHLKQKYMVGKKICFKPNYMAVARLMNSKFISLKIE